MNLYNEIKKNSLKESEILNTYLYHYSNEPNLTSFDKEFFGINSLGGLSYGNGVYFWGEPSEDYADNKHSFLYKCKVECSKVIDLEEYNALLKGAEEYYKSKGLNVWEAKYITEVMLGNGVDALVDSYVNGIPQEVVVYNLLCIKSIERMV